MQVQSRPEQHRLWTGWVVAVICVGAALALRLACAPWLDNRAAFLMFAPAAILTAWYGGLWPGILAIFAGVLLGDWFFLAPTRQFGLHNFADWTVVLSYVTTAGVGVAVCELLRGERRRAETLSAELKQRALLVQRELDQRRASEQKLRAAEQRLEAVLASINDHLVCYDRQWRYTFVNEGAARTLGRTREQLLGRCIWELFPDAVGNQYYNELHRAVAEQQVVRSEHYYAPFKTWFENHIYPTAEGVTVFSSDITWRKQAETAARTSERRFRFLAESIPQIVWTARPDGVVNYTNQRFLDYLGVDKEQVQKLGWIHFRHPEDRAEASRRWTHSVQVGEPYECMYRMLRGSDQTWRWHLARATPMRDETGQIVMWFGTCTDIDDQKRIEQELSAANRAKDQFLATLSHELRTPLTPVVLAIESMRRDRSLPPTLRDDLDMIHRNVGLETKLIDDLLDLTRVVRGKLELRFDLLDLHKTLEHAVRSCCGSEFQDKNLSMRLDLAARRVHVNADAARLEQVFFNILRNAIKFTPSGGSIDIRTRPDSGDFILIEFEDTGIGIDPRALPRIFDAFEQGDRTVTRQFGGLGLGLAVCKAIVELHGGLISAHSDGPGRGAKFTIKLPLMDAVSRAAPVDADRFDDARTASPAQRKRVLLVEDHLPTAMIMLRLLERLCFDVRLAHDLASARQLAHQHPFDLLISDLGLPDGSGLELMRELHHQTGIPGIALSGYGMEDDLAQSKAAGFVEHLVKPISINTLEAALKRVMQERDDAEPKRDRQGIPPVQAQL